MINYRVDNLNELLQVLKEEGLKLMREPVKEEYGRFAWNRRK
jgi:hypothetical protein